MDTQEQHTRDALVEALSQSSLLRILGEYMGKSSLLRKLIESAKLLEFKPGDTIITEGKKSPYMFLLAKGKVDVSSQGNSICTLARVGDVFGEIGAITGETRSATVKALTPVTCLATKAAFFDELTVEENAQLLAIMQQALSRVLGGRLKITSDELGEAHKELDELRREREDLMRENETLKKKLNEA